MLLVPTHPQGAGRGRSNLPSPGGSAGGEGALDFLPWQPLPTPSLQLPARTQGREAGRGDGFGTESSSRLSSGPGQVKDALFRCQGLVWHPGQGQQSLSLPHPSKHRVGAGCARDKSTTPPWLQQGVKYSPLSHNKVRSSPTPRSSRSQESARQELQ